MPWFCWVLAGDGVLMSSIVLFRIGVLGIVSMTLPFSVFCLGLALLAVAVVAVRHERHARLTA